MSSPAITVIVPGRDVAAFAGEALRSLQTQTLDSWRAVLVDDGSTDDTRRLFADAAAADPRFVLVEHDEPRGLGAARNSGLDLVDTPYTAFLDADDRLRPHALERLRQTLETTGSDFVVGAYVRLRPDADGPGCTAGDVQPWVAAATDPAREGTTLAQHPAASGNIVAWSKLSRTDFWHAHALRFPEGRYYEDQVVAQRMYTLATAFDVVPDVVIEWRERRDRSSITQRLSEVDLLRAPHPQPRPPAAGADRRNASGPGIPDRARGVPRDAAGVADARHPAGVHDTPHRVQR